MLAYRSQFFTFLCRWQFSLPTMSNTGLIRRIRSPPQPPTPMLGEINRLNHTRLCHTLILLRLSTKKKEVESVFNPNIFFLLAACSKLVMCVMPVAQIAVGEWVIHVYRHFMHVVWVQFLQPFSALVDKCLRDWSPVVAPPRPTGALYLDDCPRQHYIPIYLIVVGFFGLVLALLSCLPCAHQPEDAPSSPLSQLSTIWNSLTSFFLFCWFIAGEFKTNMVKDSASDI